MNKAITLTELVIAISLLAVIILGVASFDLGSRQMLKSSERKTQVMNAAALILDRISKDALTGIGDVANPAINATSTTLNIEQDDGNGVRDANDTIVSYVFNGATHTLIRTAGANPAETISSQVINFTATLPGDNTAQVTLILRQDPNNATDPMDNPQVTVQSTIEVPAWSVQ